MEIFEPNLNTLEDFADYVEERRHRPCPGAVAWLRKHDWTNVDEAPPEFAYNLLLEFRDNLGPIFRAGTIEVLGKDPFWAARTWISIGGLTVGEYNYLLARWYFRYPDLAKRAREGSVWPGGRAIVMPAAGRGSSSGVAQWTRSRSS